jgi:hypothetical protein
MKNSTTTSDESIKQTNKISDPSVQPVTLDELEEILLSSEKVDLNRSIVVKEVVRLNDIHSVIQRIKQDRFKRIITGVVIGTILVFLFVPLIFPERYEIAMKLLHTLLAVFAGIAIEKNF